MKQEGFHMDMHAMSNFSDSEISEDALTPKELTAQLDEGKNSSQLLTFKELIIKTNPSKRIIAMTHEGIHDGMKTVFVFSYKSIRNDDVRKAYEAKTEDIRREVTNQLKNISNNLDRLISNWSEEIKLLGCSVSLKYTNPVIVKVRIGCPEEHIFWDLVEKLDYLIIIMENLWHHKGLSMQNKQEVLPKLTKQFNSFAINLNHRARAVRKMNATVTDFNKKEQKNQEDQETYNSNEPIVIDEVELEEIAINDEDNDFGLDYQNQSS